MGQTLGAVEHLLEVACPWEVEMLCWVVDGICLEMWQVEELRHWLLSVEDQKGVKEGLD